VSGSPGALQRFEIWQLRSSWINDCLLRMRRHQERRQSLVSCMDRPAGTEILLYAYGWLSRKGKRGRSTNALWGVVSSPSNPEMHGCCRRLRHPGSAAIYRTNAARIPFSCHDVEVFLVIHGHHSKGQAAGLKFDPSSSKRSFKRFFFQNAQEPEGRLQGVELLVRWVGCHYVEAIRNSVAGLTDSSRNLSGVGFE
jgi:hypothetical protein